MGLFDQLKEKATEAFTQAQDGNTDAAKETVKAGAKTAADAVKTTLQSEDTKETVKAGIKTVKTAIQNIGR